MSDIQISSEATSEAAKLKELCNLVLRRADAEHEKIIDDARSEMNQWTEKQQVILDSECERISRDAKKRADEIAMRQIANARTESNRERLKLQNKCVEAARAVFQRELENLRKRGDYGEILAGLALEAMEGIPKDQSVSFRLSAADAAFGDGLADVLRKTNANVKFEPAPGEFSGGVMLSSADGHWSVISDWRAKTDELADAIAARVLAAL